MEDNSHASVAVFWDYESCTPSTRDKGFNIVERIRCVALEYGSLESFKAYLAQSQTDTSAKPNFQLSAELQCSGVTLVECPENGRKKVADNMMIVDMMMFAMNNPAPATVILISGDHGFGYVLSILRARRYDIILIAPTYAHMLLKQQATKVFDWEPLLGDHAAQQTNTIEHGHNSPMSTPTSPRNTRRDRANSFRNGQPTWKKQFNPYVHSIPDDDSDSAVDEGEIWTHGHTRSLSSSLSPSLAQLNFGVAPSQPQAPPAPSSLNEGLADINFFISQASSSSHREAQPKHVSKDVRETPRLGARSRTRTHSDTVSSDASPSDSSDVHYDRSVHSPSHGSLAPATSNPMLSNGKQMQGVSGPPSWDGSSVLHTGRRVERANAGPSPKVETRQNALFRGDLDTMHIDLVNSSARPEPTPVFSRTAAQTIPSYSLPFVPPTPVVTLPRPETPVQSSPFLALMQILEEYRINGTPYPNQRVVSIRLRSRFRNVYEQAGVTGWNEYAAAALEAGIVIIGPLDDDAWITLHPDWHDGVPLLQP